MDEKKLKINWLADIVIKVANCIDERDIEEYERGMFNLLDLPQNPEEMETALEIAEIANLDIIDDRKNGYLTIKATDNDFIRFNLYDCDEPNYGYKGDINSLDMTKSVYKRVLADNTAWSYANKELRNFMAEIEKPMSSPMTQVNKWLKASGIEPIYSLDDKYKLYRWDWSCIDCDTAFFYFTIKGVRNRFAMIEWHDDEKNVAPVMEYYTKKGECLDEHDHLTDEEMDWFANKCKEIIDMAND